MPDDFDQGAPVIDSGEGQPGQGGNPAWNELLSQVPQELHSQVIPHLQRWDAGVTKRFQEVQTKYKPYEDFASRGVSPDQINLALNVAQAIVDNPQAVYQQLGERYGFGQPEGQPQVQGQPNQDEEMWGDLPPQLRQRLEGLMSEHQQLQEAAGTMAQLLLHQREQDSEADEDAKIDAMFEEMNKDPGFAALNEQGIAEPYIISRLMAGDTPEQALEHLNKFVEHTLKTAGRPSVPRVLGSGGMIPGQATDIRKATPQQARQAVAEMVAASLAE